LYNEATKSGSNGDDDKTQHYIDALVNTSQRDSTGSGDSVTPISRRIIYLKDYGKIAQIARLLLGFILRAIQKRNRTVKDASAIDSHPPSTILVFGIASGIKLIAGKDDLDASNSKFRTQWHNALRAGGQTLGRILPQLSYKFSIMSQKEPSCSRLCPLSAQFFLPQAYTSSDLKCDTLYRCSIFNNGEPICRDFVFSVFPRNAHSEESKVLRRIAVKERTRCINEALLRLTLGELGGVTDQKLFDAVLECNDNR
jgi:hypothetical protein